jgi:hypothetical protein
MNTEEKPMQVAQALREAAEMIEAAARRETLAACPQAEPEFGAVIGKRCEEPGVLARNLLRPEHCGMVAGRTGAPAPATATFPPVSVAVDRLYEELCLTRDALGMLHSRLGIQAPPIFAMDRPSQAVPPAENGPEVLAARILAATDQLSDLRATIEQQTAVSDRLGVA